MAHQLLTGRLPFNDKRNMYNPALSAVLRSILTDKLDFQKACWADISNDGKDFVKCACPRSLFCLPWGRVPRACLLLLLLLNGAHTSRAMRTGETITSQMNCASLTRFPTQSFRTFY